MLKFTRQTDEVMTLKRRNAKASLIILAAVVLGVVASPMSAQAVGMSTASGNISCNQFPNLAVGTSATAKGDVKFQLNHKDNTGQFRTQTLGYSSVYTSWGWKFITGQAGNFYAYGYGANGNATNAKKYCQSY